MLRIWAAHENIIIFCLRFQNPLLCGVFVYSDSWHLFITSRKEFMLHIGDFARDRARETFLNFFARYCRDREPLTWLRSQRGEAQVWPISVSSAPRKCLAERNSSRKKLIQEEGRWIRLLFFLKVYVCVCAHAYTCTYVYGGGVNS